MSMQDPVADMISRINNANLVKKPFVTMPSSKIKAAIAATLKEEGYIENFHEEVKGAKKTLHLTLKYVDERPVITKLTRISKPGYRQYRPTSDLPHVVDGYGIAVMSTSKGVMSNLQARKLGMGGEVLCYVF